MSEVRWLGTGPAQRKSMLPWIKDEVVFYPHQTEAIRKLARQKSFILADEMGLGKSLQALTIFGIDVARGYCERAIVVCPATLKYNWLDEIKKFTGFEAMMLDGTPKQRESQIEEFRVMAYPRILIVNYEQVTAHIKQLNTLRFDVGIFDEAHYLKNPKAARTKASLRLWSRRKFMLSGTPMLNRVNELWTLLHMCNPNEFPNYWKFTQHYCLFGGWKNKEIVGVKNELELRHVLAKYQTRRLKKDVLDLPDVQIIERLVRLKPEQAKLYKEIEKELKYTDSNGEEQEVDNVLTKFLRLKQVANTTFPRMADDISSKLDLAVEDFKEIVESGHRGVVFTQFRDTLECFAKRLEDEGIRVWRMHGDVAKQDRVPMVRDWSTSEDIGVICCMLQVAGVGLNMTAARHGGFIDKLFVPGLNQQAVDRMHRIGASETQPIQVFDYIARGTVESRVQQILRLKATLNKDIIDTAPPLDFKRKLIEAALAEEAA